MTVVFNSDTIAPHKRVDAVATAVQEASVPSHVVLDGPQERVHATFDVWQFGEASIFRARTSGIQLIRTPKQVRTSPAPVLAVAVQQVGDGRYEQGGVQRVVRPGELHVMDLNAPYDFSWHGDGASTCLHVPLDQLGLPAELISQAAARVQDSPHYRLVANHIVQLTTVADALSADPAAALSGCASIELIRGLLLSAGSDDGNAAVVPSDILLSRMRAYVRRNLADPDLGAEQVAKAHNMSVRQLYKICANAEYSLEQWIISQRLEQVRADLTKPDHRHRTISMIARRWGFRDPSHFARRFRAAYGLSPREWRRVALDADEP
ncbi:helix-turn-helix domain-containing protein [Nocardia sp. NBC_00508]|uniref:helix-turn-helix domain-containing protein n=1 Tax=Nocardia sp. NBC_00508 TaxID=2975992 RepID=UPI002E8115BC|nr:helix-turn-helix domain-containing protein [Nocardia sp. NBC_00508]WUD67993.1 helix-turn-helix domain-containing protein [Nocardia sp. NBC_00508]